MTAEDTLAGFRAAIADPVRGPTIAQQMHAELEPIVARLGADDLTRQVRYTDEEYVRRSAALAAATEPLARMSALAGRWAPVDTARTWRQVLAALLGVGDRGNGLRPWLELLAYPALLVEYAFGLGASIGCRHDNLALMLTAPVPNERKEWQPAVLQLNPATIAEEFAIKLSGAKPRWPLSDHLLSIMRPWFTEIVSEGSTVPRHHRRLRPPRPCWGRPRDERVRSSRPRGPLHAPLPRRRTAITRGPRPQGRRGRGEDPFAGRA